MDLGLDRSTEREFNPVNEASTPLRYSGEYVDTHLQQQYLRARWYNPSNAQFNRLDDYAGSLTEPQSLHKYAYCHGDPVNGVDPSGEFTLIELLIGISIISIVGLIFLIAAGRHRKNAKGGLLGGLFTNYPRHPVHPGVYAIIIGHTKDVNKVAITDGDDGDPIGCVVLIGCRANYVPERFRSGYKPVSETVSSSFNHPTFDWTKYWQGGVGYTPEETLLAYIALLKKAEKDDVALKDHPHDFLFLLIRIETTKPVVGIPNEENIPCTKLNAKRKSAERRLKTLREQIDEASIQAGKPPSRPRPRN